MTIAFPQTYFEHMTKSRRSSGLLEVEFGDSGVVSTTPSEMDPIDRETDFVSSQEDDPGLGSTLSPKRLHSDLGNGGTYGYSKLAAVSNSFSDHASSSAPTSTETLKEGMAGTLASDEPLTCVNGDDLLTPDLGSLVSGSSPADTTSIAVGGADQ